MLSQSGWEPSWVWQIVGRSGKRVLFGYLDEEPVACVIHGSVAGVDLITVDEFNRLYREADPVGVEVVRLALQRASAQGVQLPEVITAADLLQRS